MKIREVAKLEDATVLCGEDRLDEEVLAACGSDMMSDVMGSDHCPIYLDLDI